MFDDLNFNDLDNAGDLDAEIREILAADYAEERRRRAAIVSGRRAAKRVIPRSVPILDAYHEAWYD